MNRIRSLFLLVAAVAVQHSSLCYAQVTGFAVVKPAGAPAALLTLPGSVRRIFLNCSSGCSTSGAATWSVASSSGSASAVLAPSPSGNYVDVTLGSIGGTCPVTGVSPAFNVTATASVTVKAVSRDNPLLSDTIVFDVCGPAVEAYTIPFYRVLYAGQREDVQGVVWGSSNTDGAWSILSQPAGGDATLDDTRYRDTVFHATVRGLYKVRWISSADSSKIAYSTFYVTGNIQPRLSQPNGTEPIDCTTDPNTTGGTLEVGPSQRYANLEAIAPAMMLPGVTIRLHNEDLTGANPTTYHEWMQINGAGTHDNPIRLCGVPDGAGNLPVLDGRNATARADVLSSAYLAGYAGITVYNTNYDPYPAYNGPQYILVEGLALKNYAPANSFYPAGTATGATPYIAGTAGFRFQICRDCELNGAEVSNNGNGIFAESNDARAWGGVTERLLFEGNNVHDNGVANDYHEHNWYLQGWFQVVQFNQMPTYNKAALGSQFKDRGISWFRYNLVGTGAQRMLDLVEDQDSAHYLNPNLYLTSMRVSEPRDAYTGDQLAAAQEAWHSSEAVYGNIFQQANVGSVHFAADNLGGYVMRQGTLDFYNNSINAVGANSYRFAWFDTGDNNSNFQHYEWPTINAANLVLTGWTDASNPYFSWNTQRDAFLNFGKILLPTAWGSNVQSCTNNSVGACDGTGWPYQSNSDAYFNGNALFNATGTGNFTGAGNTSPWNPATYQLTSAASGFPLTGTHARLPVRFQYVPGSGYATVRSTVVNDLSGGIIGATDSLALVQPVKIPVPPTVVSIATAPASIVLFGRTPVTLTCTTTLSDGTSRPCLNPASTSSNNAAATVSGLVLTGQATGGGATTTTAEGVTTRTYFTAYVTSPASVVFVSLTPGTTQLPLSSTTTLACTATLGDGSQRPCKLPVFSTTTGSLLAVNGSTASALASAGAATVKVVAESQTGTATINITSH